MPQFEFLVITEKNIFVYKLYCHWIFQILIIFYVETATLLPLKKVTSLFPSNPTLKIDVLSSPHFWKLGRRFKPPPHQKGEGAHYAYVLCGKKNFDLNLEAQILLNTWTSLILKLETLHKNLNYSIFTALPSLFTLRKIQKRYSLNAEKVQCNSDLNNSME